jgi:hypothetical protein
MKISKKQDNLIREMAASGSTLYRIAKETGLSRYIINNYINNNNIKLINNKPDKVIEAEIIDISTDTGSSSLPAHPINNIYNNNIYNKDNNINNINNYNDTDMVSINTDSLLDTKKDEYNKKIDNILGLIIKEYKNNINLIPKSKLGIDFGIFYDKRFPKSIDNTRINDNRSIIFANFGDNQDMISAITQIKTNKNKLVNR